MYTDEFRIGNFILDRNEEVEINGILRGGFYIENTDLKLQLNAGDRFSPIPLTEEWLIKFGFKKSYLYWRNKLSAKVEFKLQNMVWFYKGGCLQSNYIEIKSVHQLQNLYFALTGVELEINN